MHVFRITCVMCAALLFVVSAPLWTQAGDLYPQVPFFEFLRNAPALWDWFALLTVITSLGLLLTPNRRWQGFGCFAFLVGSVALVMLDQHRLQPWLQQLALLSLFALVLPTEWFWRFARWLPISIYLFSAISKFDFAFLQTLGHQFSSQAFSFAGIEFNTLPAVLRWTCAGSFPVGELLIGLGLLYPRTRTAAAWLAIVLHMTLLAILGPFGLRHQLGVLCWNLFFIAQVVILFLRSSPDADNSQTQLAQPRYRIACCLALLGLPILEPLGCYDHWPAWQLYAHGIAEW